MSFDEGARLSVCAEPPDQDWIRGRFGHEDGQQVTHTRPLIEDVVVFKIEFFHDAAVQTMWNVMEWMPGAQTEAAPMAKL